MAAGLHHLLRQLLLVEFFFNTENTEYTEEHRENLSRQGGGMRSLKALHRELRRHSSCAILHAPAPTLAAYGRLRIIINERRVVRVEGGKGKNSLEKIRKTYKNLVFFLQLSEIILIFAASECMFWLSG